MVGFCRGKQCLERQKSSKTVTRRGEGVDCRHQPVGRTGQSARKIFLVSRRGEAKEENRDDGV